MARIPKDGAPSVGTNGGSGCWRDVQRCTHAVVDALAHTRVDQKQQAEALEHLSGASHRPVGKMHLRRHVSLHDVLNAQRPRVAFEKLLLAALRQSRVDPGFPPSPAAVEPRFE